MAEIIHEDDPRWNPMTMGNRTYGGARGYPRVHADEVQPRSREPLGRALMRRQPRKLESLLRLIALIQSRHPE